jgi:hypothetical protein
MSNTIGLKVDDFAFIRAGFRDFLYELRDDDRLAELENYVSSNIDVNWNIEKVKILLETLKLKNRENEHEILSYLKHIEYGWQNGIYRLNNKCLLKTRHCKENYKIDNTWEATSGAFENIGWIFSHDSYGGITSYLFGYCLAALFSSRLKKDTLRMPYFLQIACERNSNVYRLIHEIVDICDVNTDLIEHCNMDFDYGYCDYDYVTVFPTQSVDKTLDNLVCNRDIPVIIDGYENEKFYGALLREMANIPSKMRPLDIKSRFNILPIFICPVIRSQFKNVFSIDLTDLDIDEEYLGILQENKQRLASWALELVKHAKDYFFQRNTKEDIILRKNEDERPFFDHINKHIDRIRKENWQHTEVTSKDIANIGFLTYFLSRYMGVFKKSIKLDDGVKFPYKGKFEAHNPSKLISEIINSSKQLLFKIHNTNSPTLPMTVTVVTNDQSIDATKAKQAKKKGEEYAKKLVKYYQSYGVSLKIQPEAEFKDDRYVFNIKLMPGTDGNLINRHVDSVRRLLDLAFLKIDKSHSSIKIIASEKDLKENSLLKILKSPNFKESEMEIPYAVGYDMMGEMVIVDIAQFNHLLIGGTSGSGKSSALHSLLMSIVCKQKADKVKLLLLDFGGSRLKMFNNTPHMVEPTITVREFEKGQKYILALTRLMEKRLEKLELIDERKYDKEIEKWPCIICVIDEFPTFIRKLTAGKGNKLSYMLVADLLERARKVKIHLILAAQDATQGNIAIKNTNFDAAIAFMCTNEYGSRAIINAPDARNLSEKGAMYFKCYQHDGLKRMQGSFMKPVEIMDMLDGIKLDDGAIQHNEVKSELRSLAGLNDAILEADVPHQQDTDEEMLARIIIWLLGQNKISNKQIKDYFEMGYDRAKVFLSKLESSNLVTNQKTGSKLSRTVIPKSMDDIPVKVMEFLVGCGYTKDEVKNALNKRSSIADVQADTAQD